MPRLCEEIRFWKKKRGIRKKKRAENQSAWASRKSSCKNDSKRGG